MADSILAECERNDRLRTELAAVTQRAAAAEGVIAVMEQIACEAYAFWDTAKPNDSKIGKYLGALGGNDNRVDLNRARSVLAAVTSAASEQAMPDEQHTQRERATRDEQHIRHVRYWVNAYSNPASGEHFRGHGVMVGLLREYLALLEAGAAPAATAPCITGEISTDGLECAEPTQGVQVPYEAFSANGRGMEWRGQLWDAINALPPESTSAGRQYAVVRVEEAVALAMQIAIEEHVAGAEGRV